MEPWIESLLGLPTPLIWAALTFAAGIEYVLPPFPGDAFVLGGAVLAGSSGLLWVPIFIAVTLGSVLGAWLDYELGLWLRREDRQTWLHRLTRRPRVARGIERVTRGFVRHGDLYLTINRFLPGLRAFFFIAAGLARLPRVRVLTLATLAALLWNGLLVGVGLVLGANLDALLDFLATYSRVAWIIVGLVALGLIVRWVLARRSEELR